MQTVFAVNFENKLHCKTVKNIFGETNKNVRDSSFLRYGRQPDA